MRPKQIVWIAVAAALALGLGGVSGAAPKKKKKRLSSRQIKKLEKKARMAAADEKWSDLADVIEELAKANKKKQWKLMLKLADRAPANSRVPQALVRAAQKMTDKRVQKEVRKAIKSSRSAAVRMNLLEVFVDKREWGPVIDALGDKDEEVAFVAAWNLSKHRVERGVEPLIKAMEKLDKTQDGIWYELGQALARMLGKKLNSGIEYRSWWQGLKAKGGLKAVKRDRPRTGKPNPNDMKTTTRNFFGRSIDSNRVVFILDVSGSMAKIDPPRQRSGRVGPGRSGERGKPAPRVKLKNRLARAKEQLIKVLSALPNRTRINIITFASKDQIAIWKDADPPGLHRLTPDNRDSAKEFVKGFKCLGATATDLALIKAYTIKGARAFYLLSDGVPSHGAPHIIATRDVLKIIDGHDRGRHIRIHTLGFRGAPKDLMQGLAGKTGGKYSDIPPQ